MSPQLLTISLTPTPHAFVASDEDFFVDLPEDAVDRVLPLLRIPGSVFGLELPFVPVVYHETFRHDAIELIPHGDRFELVPLAWDDMEESDTRERIETFGHVGLHAFDPGGRSGWDALAPAKEAYWSGLDGSHLEALSERDLEPVVGHVGFEPCYVQASAPRGIRGRFLLQVNAYDLGLCDVHFYVFWDADTGRFIQALQMT